MLTLRLLHGPGIRVVHIDSKMFQTVTCTVLVHLGSNEVEAIIENRTTPKKLSSICQAETIDFIVYGSPETFGVTGEA